MDPIDVEPLCYVLPLSLVPYITLKDKVPTTEVSRNKESSPINSPNTKHTNLEANNVRTPP